MKSKKTNVVNIAAVAIFTVAFFLNFQTGIHEGFGFIGITAIGGGTGSGGSGSGSGDATYDAIPYVCACVDSVGTEHDYGSKIDCSTGGTAECTSTSCPPALPICHN